VLRLELYKLAEEAVSAGANANSMLVLGPLLSAGQMELLTRSSEKLAHLTKILIGLTIVLALVTVALIVQAAS
jgi:hypothetical protein